MRQEKLNESGTTLMDIVKMLGWIALTAAVLGVGVHFFNRTLFGDSATEDTIKELSSRAISISTQLISGQDKIILDEYGALTRQGFTASAYTTAEGFFEISLLNVSKSVCRSLQSGRWRQPSSIYINGALADPNKVQCRKLNHMSFEFSRDLNEHISNADKPRAQHCQSDSDCAGCSVCQNGRCYSGCTTGEKCGKTLKGRDVCCSEKEYDDPFCCPYTEDGNCCWGRGQCCPLESPILLSDGTCTDCYDTRVFAVGEPPDIQSCLTLCPNRVSFGSGGLCMLPVCMQNQFMSREDGCMSCDAVGSVATSAQECARCPNRVYARGLCGLACPESSIMDKSGACVSCETTEVLYPQEANTCAQTCPNRKQNGKACVLSACPDGTIPDKTGACLSCDTPTAIFGASAETCALCPNRTMAYEACVPACEPGTFRASDGRCVSCNADEAYPVPRGSTECMNCPSRLALENYCFSACRPGQFRDAFGACHSCYDLGSYPVVETSACGVCSNRSILLRRQDNTHQAYCIPQYCPIDYFADTLGTCHDCFQTTPVEQTTQEECEKCPNRMWSPLHDTCFLRPTCAPNEVIDSEGKCRSCQSDEEIFSVLGQESTCNMCPGRYVFGYWCRRCPADVTTLTTKDGCQKCGGNWDNRIAQCSVR